MRALLKSPRLWLYASAVLVLAAAAPAMAGGVSLRSIVDSDSGLPLLWPSYVTEFDGALYFRSTTTSSSSNTGLWRFDGSDASLVPDTFGREPSYMAAYNGRLYFCATASGGGSKLWQYSVAEGASQAPGSSSGAALPQDMHAYNGQLYFRAARFSSTNIGIELWKFDGTNQTPIDMYPGSGSSYPQHFIQYNGLLYFNACGTPGQGTELWRTNGTGMPIEAARIYPNNGSSPENFAVYNNELYFSAYTGDTTGRELWKYNGDVPSLAADIYTGAPYHSSNPHDLIAYKGKLYFGANDGVSGDELWCFDGTTPNKVAEINPTPDPGDGDTFMMDSSPHNMVVFNDILYFAANDGEHGVELWSFDGAEVKMVMDINPGQYGSEVQELTVFNGALYFSADDGYVPGFNVLQPQVYMLTPEPATLALMAFGALALLRRRRR